MFWPNNTATWSTAGPNDKFGQKKWSNPVALPCAVVKFMPMTKQSNIRSTASASHSFADELENASIILFGASTPIALGDLVTIFGATLVCMSVRAQADITGVIDHYECAFQAQAV